MSEERTETNRERVMWLIRLPEVFRDEEPMVLAGLGVERVKRLGRDYVLVRVAGTGLDLQDLSVSKYVAWNLPVDHSWPCSPKKVEGFIEKAAQSLAGKFGGMGLQGVFVGCLDAGEPDQYHRKLASNLRGRMLQVFGDRIGGVKEAEAQDRTQKSLFVLVGKEGLFAGVSSPRVSGGYYPGGTKFIKQSSPDVISRAGAKVVEALHVLSLYRDVPAVGGHWLELGASPGGMTMELLQRGYRVTAVDRAPLDERVLKMPGLAAVVGDAGQFRIAAGDVYDAILSDMNGVPEEAMRNVLRFVRALREGGVVIFTLKTAGCEGDEAICQVQGRVERMAEEAGLRLVGLRHLTYNRREFTYFWEKSS